MPKGRERDASLPTTVSPGVDRNGRFAPVATEPVTHPLIGIARDLHARMVQRLREEHAYAGLRPSLGPLLSLVWLEPRPLTLLAQRLAISKQGAGQLARLAEASGYLERVVDTADGRSRQVGLSSRGRRLVNDAIRIMRDGEAEYAAQVGAARFRRFAEACATLYLELGVHPRVDAVGIDALRPALGGLPQLALEIQRRLIAATSARGHRGLKLSQAQILPRIGPEGMRVRDLSLRHGVSRQAVSSTCRELEGLGYLRRREDPGDRRGAILRLTRRGERLLADSVEASRALESEFAERLGRDGFVDLRDTAHALFESMREREPDLLAAGGVRRTAPAFGVRDVLEDCDGLEELAKRLRRRLSARDAARLGRLLGARREMPRAVEVFPPSTRSRA